MPRGTSTPSAVRTQIWAHALGHISLFPPSLARLPISLFIAAYAGYTPACYRAAIAQRSKHRRHFKVRHCLPVFPVLVSVFIYRRELSYRTSMRRNSTTNWALNAVTVPGKLATLLQLLDTELCWVSFDRAFGRDPPCPVDFKVIV